ncbi:MAG TPA: sulfite exporter TauE/SafE family protein [Solirubrobacteraceae bacterium]|jgi:hypothetical protein|nr:sulfite exporter TauE/SafE family protein [Solirubrobacteraceae bacterium]
MDPLIVLFGLGVGILVGTTGMGGGSLMTPALILVFGIQPVVAIGTDLVYGAVTKTLGGWRHLRQGTVNVPLVAWLAVGSVPGAIAGVLSLNALRSAYGGKNFDSAVLVAVAAALLLVATAVLVRVLVLPRLVARERDTLVVGRREKAMAVPFGLAIGFVLAVTSAGSGSLIAVGLILLYRLKPRGVVGTDVVHAAILLWVAGFLHILSGNVDFGLAANILIGSLPGVWIGAGLSARLPENALRPALAIVLVASGLALLSKSGANIPPVWIFGGPLALAAFVTPLLVRRAARDRAANPVSRTLTPRPTPPSSL